MCWNETISLNTFLFSSFVLILIMYNNYFTKYKIHELHNKWIYLFIASFVFMQLLEFFIWRNIDHPFYNNVFSILATLLLLIQPMISIMIVTNIKLRNLLLSAYLLLVIPFSIYKFSTRYIHSVKSESGHLRWKFFETTPFIWGIWLFFFLFSFIYKKNWGGLVFGLVTLVIAFINYKQDHTMWSMWCWIVNAMLIYYAIYLLVYLPFAEKNDIC
jgi:hypothetical protein